MIVYVLSSHDESEGADNVVRVTIDKSKVLEMFDEGWPYDSCREKYVAKLNDLIQKSDKELMSKPGWIIEEFWGGCCLHVMAMEKL